MDKISRKNPLGIGFQGLGFYFDCNISKVYEIY
jgi:hypothetical protein